MAGASTTLRLRAFDAAALDAAPVHLLPCTVERTGAAPVSTYFYPHDTEQRVDGAVVQEATFRGRQLCGVTHALPDGYQGVVLARDPKGEAWRASSAFARFTAWNHDTQPTSADAAPRVLHWLRLASALAAPVDADAVTRRVAEGQPAAAGAPAEAGAS